MFGSKKKKQKQFSPWYGFLVLLVIGIAFGLKIANGLRPHVVAPTASVPAVSYDEVVDTQPTETDIDSTIKPPEQENDSDSIETDTNVTDEKPATQDALPTEFNLAVPFTSQAPTGNWDALHEDACEEASFFMVEQFYAGIPEGKIDPAVADPEIQRLVHAEEMIGLTPSITLAEAKDFFAQDSGAVGVIVENPTVEGIKKLIAEGRPVIVPAAGRRLGNPFFTGEGPLYHMLVIRGYTADTFITNDPGTRMGEGYVYDINTLIEAIGDWNNGDPEHGAKRIMYIQPDK